MSMDMALGSPCFEPNGSPIQSMGASSRSPSPIATRPSNGTESKTSRIASTAAPSAAFPSPSPFHFEAAIAAASVAFRNSGIRSAVGMSL